MKKAVNLILFGLICFLSTSCVDKDLFPYPKEPQKFTRITSIDWTNFFPEEKEGGKEQYIYDEAGNLLEILNINEDNSINQNFIPKRTNGQVTSMDYFDSKGEKISEIFYKYDKSGRIIETKWTPLILSHPNREEYIWNGDKIIEIKLFYKYYLELNKDTVVIFNYIHDEKGNVIRS